MIGAHQKSQPAFTNALEQMKRHRNVGNYLAKRTLKKEGKQK